MRGAFAVGMAWLVLAVRRLMGSVTVLVGMGREAMVDFLRGAAGIVNATGAWVMVCSGIPMAVLKSASPVSVSP